VARKNLARLAALVAAALLALAACGGGSDGETAGEPAPETGTPAQTGSGAETAAEGEATRGGTYRLEWEASFDFSDAFDPTGEYLGDAIGIHTNLLVRTLVGYRHTAGAAGNEIVPDLATDTGQVSEDGLTYTFTIKDGVKFGPPLSRNITSQDLRYAIERIGQDGRALSQYSGYYDVIEGFNEFADGKADEISGIETPDDKTISFTLTQPTGDFLYRLSMPAAGAIPEEVAGCFDEAGLYGRYVISSGPYMIEGSDQLDATSCDTLTPLSGFDPNESLALVRNPDYGQSTDDTRENNPDRFVWTINTNTEDIFNRVKEGLLDDEVATETPQVLREYTQDEELKDRLKINAGDRTWFLMMNLTQPPFDDVHVRKAVNWVIDKEGLRRAWGGSTAGEIGNHIVPDSMFNDDLADYAPYGTEGDAGDVEKAKEEMRQSKYDTDGDGICDAPECKDVLHIAGTRGVDTAMTPVVQSSLEKIGITLTTRPNEDSYTIIQTTENNTPFSSRPGWGKDYADAYTFFYYMFYGPTIQPLGNVNYWLVGLTPDRVDELGVEGTVDGIPSVDADIEACSALTGDERVTCWEDLDRKLMEEVAPIVPYLDATTTQVIGPAVTKWDWDQFSGTIAYSQVAVDPARQ
jgi:peptide/nickel transport system substrate-binding protein